MLDGDAAVAELEARLRSLQRDISHLLVQLRVSGVLSLEGLELFERTVRDGVGGAVRALRIDDAGLRLLPSASDLAALARAGTVGVAAERLRQRADDPADPQRDLAQAALQRLYLIHVPDRNHRRLGSQSSDRRARNHCNGFEGSGPESLHASP